jgi:ribosomal protein RSM22 (predicted rRNA methylase)
MAEVAKRLYRLPVSLAEWLERKFKDKKTAQLAQAIQKLSDAYNSTEDRHSRINSLFTKEETQEAYLAYFFPLNFMRNQAVFDQLSEINFFQDLETWIDYGSGVGTASLALQMTTKTGFQNSIAIEKDSWSMIEHLNLQKELVGAIELEQLKHWPSFHDMRKKINVQKTCALFSYSYNELDRLPVGAEDCEAIVVIEPSTQLHGRKLLNLRAQLLSESYSAWAPCTHQTECPLLTISQRDWCHDRIFIEMPPYYYELEKHLSMENRSLTYSYLAMRRKPARDVANIARVVGDTLDEKGKVRQMFCRGSEREFLAWMKKNGEAQFLPRGVRIEMNSSFEKKSNEVRVTDKIKII